CYDSNENERQCGTLAQRALCNTNSTLQKVKDIMFQYNVTATSDGRLIDVEYVGNYESKFMISIPLMIMIIFGLLSN
ncbi:unnamed protein product, partial [Rotaria sp. Silwood1]